MKNISLALNALLLVAVSYLYYLHFSSSRSNPSLAETSDSTNTVVEIAPKDVKDYPIVYVNADSLYEKYDYVIALKKDLLSKQKFMENSYQTQVQDFQQKYYQLQQQAQAGQITADQAKIEEEKLAKQKETIDGLEMNLGKLQEEIAKKNQGVQVLIGEFLERYNKDGLYKFVLAYTSTTGGILFADSELDITNDVVGGLNAEYAAQKNKRK